MNGPPRLRDSSWSRARALLLAAEDDVPEAGARQRALQGLGLATASSVAATAIAAKTMGATKAAAVGAPAALSNVSVMLMVGKVVAVIASVVVCAAVAPSMWRHFAKAPERSLIHKKRPDAVASASIGQPNAVADDAPLATMSKGAAVEARRQPVVGASKGPSDSSSASARVGALRGVNLPVRERAASIPLAPRTTESALIVQAEKALAAHDPRVAIAVITQYRTAYVNRRFDEEASVLAIDALVQSGAKVEAVREGNTFLSAHPRSTYRARVQSLMHAAK
ncbi:MAG: hypothetical protein NVS3B20_18440 [Polyangiales bacterium]